MRISCISDLHMGDGSRADSFGHTDENFLRFLDYLESISDRIVVNGDVIETSKGLLPGRPLLQRERVFEAHRRILERFAHPMYVQMAGNHDAIVERLGVRSSWRWSEEHGIDVLFQHGHQFDPLRSAGRIPPLASWGFGWLERLGWRHAEAFFSRADEVFGAMTRRSNDFLLRDAAIRVLDERAANARPLYVVMGHTHERPAVVTHPRGAYINCGACLYGRLQFAWIDTTTGRSRVVSLSRVKANGTARRTVYPRTKK